VRIRAYYSDGEYDAYLVPMALAEGASGEAIAHDHPKALMAHVKGPSGTAVLFDATADDEFCLRILKLIEDGGTLKTAAGQLKGVPTSAFEAVRGEGELGPIRRGSGEQSNTTIVFGNRLILKLFRRLEVGINPDFEIGRFLSEKAAFPRVQKTAGAIEYRKPRRSEPSTMAIVQELVPNQGQGWEWMLGVLNRYYEQVASESHRLEKIEIPPLHVFDLSDIEPPEDVFQAVGAALRSAAVLGQRTAEMHLALTSAPDVPDFAPEPLTAADLDEYSERLRAQARLSFETLRSKLDVVPTDVRQLAEEVLAEVPARVQSAGEPIRDHESLVKIRCHGDYHLGQVLWQESDFVILDFEGEPTKTIAERRAKQSPMKDVAGMLRSFEYAAYSELLNVCRDQPEAFERLEPWARIWRTWTSATFLGSYRKTAAESILLPADTEPTRRLLDLFMLEKLLFELKYELDYRPNWVRIPLFGIIQLIRPAEVREVKIHEEP
jgi:maltose alpha-D-glucosyltransferase/alpha-amylase